MILYIIIYIYYILKWGEKQKHGERGNECQLEWYIRCVSVETKSMGVS